MSAFSQKRFLNFHFVVLLVIAVLLVTSAPYGVRAQEEDAAAADENAEPNSPYQNFYDVAKHAQNNIDSLNNAMRVLMDIEKESSDVKLKPLYRDRAYLIAKVPFFWKQVFENHPHHARWLSRADRHALKFVRRVNVEAMTVSKFNISFEMQSNTFFEETVLWRVVDEGRDTRDEVSSEPRSSGATVAEAMRSTSGGDDVDSAAASSSSYEIEDFKLFRYFSREVQESGIGEVITHMILYDVWLDPVAHYFQKE
eukprot:PhM_4_TR16346/c0_g1_i1/m.86712/K11290/SET, TAF1, I2PP2A; template-activating factor I